MALLPIVLSGGQKTEYPNGDLLKFALASFAAYDRVSTLTYVDSGLRTMRTDTVTWTSALHPDSDVVAQLFYLDVGKLNQRIDKIEFTGAVFGAMTLRKVFQYALSGLRYSMTGFYYELV